jgi:hypothetical protein
MVRLLDASALEIFPAKNGWTSDTWQATDSESRASLAHDLVAKAMQYADSKHCEVLKAFVPAVQPYVDVYKRSGFQPVRRSLRIGGT